MEIGQIIQLQVADLGCIKFVNIGLDKNNNLVRIAGDNDAGKSTVISAIKFAMEGAANIPQDIIRHGTYKEGDRAGAPIDRAYIRLETDQGYIIERVIRKNKKGEQVTELNVTRSGEGAIEGGAQTFLDSVASKYPDPSRLAVQPSKDLWKVLVEIFGLDFKTEDEKIAELRTEAQFLRRQLKAIGVPEKPQTDEDTEHFLRWDEEDIDKFVREFHERDKELLQIKEKRSHAARQAEDAEQKLEDLQKQMSAINDSIHATKTLLDDHRISMSQYDHQLKDGKDKLEEHRSAVFYAETAKSVIRAMKEYEAKISEGESIKTALEETAATIKKLEESKRKKIAEAKLPEGLLLTEDGQVVKGEFNWDTLSDSERLKTAMQIACRTLPEDGLRYLYIQRGESIGLEKRKIIAQTAKEYNAIVFMEVFTEHKIPEDGVIHIREGEIVQPEEQSKPTLDKLF